MAEDSSTGGGQQSTKAGVFSSHPQKYPRAMANATAMAGSLQTLVRRGPRSLVATVIDTSFHVSQGYVLCTTEQGIIRVYSIPYGSVVTQMRVYARIQGGGATNRSYVFDGFAPTLSSQSQTGSILYTAFNPVGGSTLFSTTTSSLATASSVTSSIGYYWHFFFYIPALPTTTAVLLSMWTGSVSTGLNIELLASGLLRCRSVNDGHGYITTNVIAPHRIHYVQMQPGLSGLELIVDGVVAYTGLLSNPDHPTFAGGAATYTLVLLSDAVGNYQCPLGSWVSKVGFGSSSTGGIVIPLATGLSVPSRDAQVPAFNLSSTQQTTALYLCNDTAGSTSAANTAPAGSASALTLTATCASVSALGPY